MVLLTVAVPSIERTPFTVGDVAKFLIPLPDKVRLL